MQKPLVVAGCVPQGSRDLKFMHRTSFHVHQLLLAHRLVVMGNPLIKNSYTLHVQKNRVIEILPINVGCLGACTYCKTKHARGLLGSYTMDENTLRNTITAALLICTR